MRNPNTQFCKYLNFRRSYKISLKLQLINFINTDILDTQTKLLIFCAQTHTATDNGKTLSTHYTYIG